MPGHDESEVLTVHCRDGSTVGGDLQASQRNSEASKGGGNGKSGGGRVCASAESGGRVGADGSRGVFDDRSRGEGEFMALAVDPPQKRTWGAIEW